LGRGHPYSDIVFYPRVGSLTQVGTLSPPLYAAAPKVRKSFQFGAIRAQPRNHCLCNCVVGWEDAGWLAKPASAFRLSRHSSPRVWTALLCSLVPEDQTDESVLGKIQALVKE
jgi:hypothetical protein